jgi:hypothetical protein
MAAAPAPHYTPRTVKRAPGFVLVALLLPAAAHAGQARPPDVDYAPVETPGPIPATAFVMPDLPDSWKAASVYDGRWISSRPAIVGLVDYNAFWQDEDSEAQVGRQQNGWDLRTWRFMGGGQVKPPIRLITSSASS